MPPRVLSLLSATLPAENKSLGGIYTMRSLKDIESEMRQAAERLEDALFVEYWGASVAPPRRIREWLERADQYAKDWIPSNELFLQ